MSLTSQFNTRGFCVINNLFNKKILFKVKKEILKKVKTKNNFFPAKDIKYYEKIDYNLRAPNGSLKKNLKKKDLKKGLSHIKGLTNSVSLRNPLINIKYLDNLIYEKKLFNIVNKIFRSKTFFLGYIKVGLFFNNKLPKNCINYFHTDDLKNKNSNDISTIKFSVALNGEYKTKSEFGIIPVNKNKLSIKKQYFLKNEINKTISKKIIHPIISSGDAILFDPINFYHVANKPKQKPRIIIYIEFLKRSKKKIYNKIKIKKNFYNKLTEENKKISKNFLTI
tara:strand:- start:171 stop:1010 length:840 start_codon:yes stop_codon:yes gene_type:complete